MIQGAAFAQVWRTFYNGYVLLLCVFACLLFWALTLGHKTAAINGYTLFEGWGKNASSIDI